MSEEATLDDFAEQGGNDEITDEHPRFGALPEDWDISEIADIAEVIGGSTPSTSNEKYWDGGIPWATPTDITALSGTTISETEDTITQEGLESASTHLLPPKSVLMTSRATIGKCAINTVEMATNQGFKNLVPSDEIEPWYLYYRMLDTAAFLNSLGSGSTFDEVSKTEVQSVDIPIPALPEQRKIATVLHTVDRAIEKTGEIINQKEQVRKGLMYDTFTGSHSESTKSVRLSAVDTELPEHWEVMSVGEVSTQITDGAHLTPDRSEEGYLLLSARNVRDGYLDLSDVDYIPESEYERLIEKCNPQPGDILISCSGTVGRVCEVPENLEFALVRSAALVKFDQSILPSYAEKVLQSSGVQKQIKGYQTQSAQPNLFQGQIASLEIPIPPIEEQSEIAEKFDSIDNSIDSDQQYLSQLKRLKQGLMQDLLSGKVRTTDTNIEVPEEIRQHG